MNIRKKSAVGTQAVSKYNQRTEMFSRVNAKVEEISNIQPLANYFGKKPDLTKDKFDRNVVSKLSDISFEEESEDDFEDIKNIKR